MLGTKAFMFCFIFCDFRLAMLIMNFHLFGVSGFLILDGLAKVSDILV